MNTMMTQTRKAGFLVILIGLLLPALLFGQDTAPTTTTQKAKSKGKAASVLRISATVEGTVIETKVSTGDTVEKGQILLQLESQEQEVRLQIAQAMRKAAEAEHMVKRGELEAAEARVARLKEGATKPAQVQAAETALKIGKARLMKSEASMAAAQMEISLCQLQLARTRILAPVSGKVKRLTTQMGEFVSKKQVVVLIVRDDS